MRLRVFALMTIILLMIPAAAYGMPSPSRQLGPPVTADWIPRTCPSGYYVNFTQISTPCGQGYHVDSIGNSSQSYDFMGYTNNTFAVAPDGTLTVWGWFRQSDTFNASFQPGRRHVLIYVFYTGTPESVAKTVVVLSCDDGTTWHFKNLTICGLLPGKLVSIGIGRDNYWHTEWNEVAEWAVVQVSGNSAGSSWSAASSPNGHSFNFYTVVTPFGPGYHIDSSGSLDSSYAFYGYTTEVFTVGRSGEIRMRGWFRQYDTWTGTYLKAVTMFAINAANPSVQIAVVNVLDYTDENEWEYKDVVMGGLVPGSQVRIGIGRWDGWVTDWQLTAEWTCVEILTENFDQSAPGLKWNVNLGFPSNSSIAVGNLDSNGRIEAVVGTFDGSLYRVNCLTGTLDWSYHIPNSFDAKPAIGDVDGDKKPEIVVVTSAGGLYCFNGAGAIKWNTSVGSGVSAPPTLADLNGDGREEILVASTDGHVYCFNGTGVIKWITFTGGEFIFSSPRCIDFRGDNTSEIVIGSLTNMLYFLNSSGALEWSCATAGGIVYPVAASDINNDGILEAIAATINGWIYCLNETGGIVWSYNSGGEFTSPPVVGDINHDGIQEILEFVGLGFCNLTCLDFFQGLVWTIHIGGPTNCQPLIADLGSNTRTEILINSAGMLNCISPDGVMEWGIQTAQYMCFPPIVGDFDNDNLTEIMLMGDTTLRFYDYDSPLPTRLWVIVSDAQGLPIAGASIECTFTPNGQPLFNGMTTSNGDGHVSFISLVSGYYGLQFSCSGYKSTSITTYLGNSTTQTVHVYLSPSSGSGGGGGGNGGGGGGGLFDIPFYAVLSTVVVIFVLLLVVGIVKRNTGENGTRTGPVYTSDRSRVAPVTRPTEEKSALQVPPQTTCPSCGATIEFDGAQYCQSCGANLQTIKQTSPTPTRKIVRSICIVCGLQLQIGSDTVRCPHCGGMAHRTHMLEWLHVKDYCPMCRRHLEEKDLN